MDPSPRHFSPVTDRPRPLLSVLLVAGAAAVLAILVAIISDSPAEPDGGWVNIPPTTSAPTTTSSSIPVEEKTCEQLLQIEECGPGGVYDVGFANWRQNLPALVDTGVLAAHELRDEQHDYAHLGFTVCGFAYEQQSGFYGWQAWLGSDPTLDDLGPDAAADLWNRTLRAMCPELDKFTITLEPVSG